MFKLKQSSSHPGLREKRHANSSLFCDVRWMFVENNKFMLGKYVFLNVIFFCCCFFVYTLLVCLYTHDGWGLSHRRPLTRPTFRAREKWFDIFHQRECFFFYIFFLLCFIGKTVSRHGRWKRNESDRIFRIMNVCVYAGGSFVLLWWRRWNPGERNIFLLMLPWAMRIGL